jgi:hypothetical protein
LARLSKVDKAVAIGEAQFRFLPDQSVYRLQTLYRFSHTLYKLIQSVVILFRPSHLLNPASLISSVVMRPCAAALTAGIVGRY